MFSNLCSASMYSAVYKIILPFIAHSGFINQNMVMLLRELIWLCTFCRWCFDVEIVYLSKRFHIPIVEISVNWSEIPGSKVNPLSIPNMLWELALMSMGYRTGMWRLHT